MPELPEAEIIARGLDETLRGRRFGHVRLDRADVFHGDPRSLVEAVSGRRVTDVYRRGKRVLISVNSGATLVFALGMTGRLTVERSKTPCLPHTHVRVAVERGARELRFRDPRRFGGVWLLSAAEGTSQHTGRDGIDAAARDRPLGPLGEDPFETNIRRFRTLLRRTRRIKGLLLDQRCIAGLGNIYADESLYRAHIHPMTPACELTDEQSAALLRHIRAVLREAVRRGGSTLMDYRDSRGNAGRFQRFHRVYGRAGRPCRDCGATIARVIVAGRSTHYCPSCQARRA